MVGPYLESGPQSGPIANARAARSKKARTGARKNRLAGFETPQATTWLMMPVEGAFLASVIARLGKPKFNLAAFGVAFSFAMLRARAVMHITAPRRHTIHDYGAVVVPPLTAAHVPPLVGRELHGNRRRRRAPCGYSWRRASMGSRREARHAG